MSPARLIPLFGMLISLASTTPAASSAPLRLHENGYFAAPGLNVFVYNNSYDGSFSDSKIAGIELIHHEVRTAPPGNGPQL